MDMVIFDSEASVNQKEARTTEEVDALLELRDHRFHGLIRSREEQTIFRDRYIERNNQRYKAKTDALDDFPKTQEAIMQHVRELFEAIVDFGNVIEGTRPGSDVGPALHVDEADGACHDKDDFTAQEENNGTRLGVVAEHFNIRRVRSMTNAQVEIMAWDLLYATRQASLGHPSPYPWPAWKSFIGHKQYASWTERFHHVKEECRKSKNAIANMMMARFLHRFASAPEAEFHRKVMNKKVNRRRDVHLKAAAHAIKAGEYIVTEGLGLHTRTGQEIAPENQATDQLEHELRRIKRRTSEPTTGASKKRRRYIRGPEPVASVPPVPASAFGNPAAILANPEATIPVAASTSVTAEVVPATSLESSTYHSLDLDHLYGQAFLPPRAPPSMSSRGAQGETTEGFHQPWPVLCDPTFIIDAPHLNPDPQPSFIHSETSQQASQPPPVSVPVSSGVQAPCDIHPPPALGGDPFTTSTIPENIPNGLFSSYAPSFFDVELDPTLLDW